MSFDETAIKKFNPACDSYKRLTYCRFISSLSPLLYRYNRHLSIINIAFALNCCFRHLEKPIKTKENKVKHFGYCCFCFYLFLLVLSCFFRRRKQIFQTQRRKVAKFFYYFNNDFHPDFPLRFSSRFLSEERAKQAYFSSKYFRVDFHPDYCRDFKIQAENLEKIFAESIGRIFFLRFSRKLLLNVEEVGGRRESQILRESLRKSG